MLVLVLCMCTYVCVCVYNRCVRVCVCVLVGPSPPNPGRKREMEGGEGWVKLIERNENENRETRQRWRNSTIRYGFSTSPLSVPATFDKSPLAVPAISELMSHSNPFTRTLMRNNITTNHANKYPITITHSSLQSGGTIKFSCPLKLLYLLLEPPTMTTRTPS